MSPPYGYIDPLDLQNAQAIDLCVHFLILSEQKHLLESLNIRRKRLFISDNLPMTIKNTKK